MRQSSRVPGLLCWRCGRTNLSSPEDGRREISKWRRRNPGPREISLSHVVPSHLMSSQVSVWSRVSCLRFGSVWKASYLFGSSWKASFLFWLEWRISVHKVISGLIHSTNKALYETVFSRSCATLLTHLVYVHTSFTSHIYKVTTHIRYQTCGKNDVGCSLRSNEGP